MCRLVENPVFLICGLAIALLHQYPVAAQEEGVLDSAAVTRFAELALECIHREYPNKISHVLNSAEDAKPPHELTPVFFGCYDWHSAVHGHWLLVRLCRVYPQNPLVARARDALSKSFTPEKVPPRSRTCPARAQTFGGLTA
jgi:hypothetical protein